MNLAGCVDKVKEYLIPKRFGIVAYVCVILHFQAGLLIFGATVELSTREEREFSCYFGGESGKSYQKQVEQTCLSKYHKTYETPLPLYQFVSLSFGCAVIITFVYSMIVWRRIDEIDLNLEQSENEGENQAHNWKTVYVFYFYFAHLVLRSILGIILTVLQHAYFYPNGFESKFNCILPSIKKNTPKTTSQYLKRKTHFMQCENPTSFERWIWSILVSVINIMFAFVLLFEVVYLCQRGQIFQSTRTMAWRYDTGFVIEYFLRKPYEPPETSDECVKFYKQAAFENQKLTGLGDLYVDAVIHTERAPHRFNKDMGRGEIYKAYTKVPQNSVPLEKIEDLFHPNVDTKDNVPLRILVTGRPGIGKTSLAKKIVADWARGTDEYYRDKIVFLFKFRLFKGNAWLNLTLKQFLQFGSGLDKRKFRSIYETALEQPSKVILIFDGLDEFHDDAIGYFDKSATIPHETDTRMSAMDLFIKLVMGDMLKGATVLVMSRPTADDFYSKLNFDRDVEITGFTPERIEIYVTRFCEDKGRSELKPIIWNHIKTSSDLLNLCYIPVNCYIVCITLSAYDPSEELPRTMTKLYRNAIYHLKEEHSREAGADTSQKESQSMKPKKPKTLEELAFVGVRNGQLVFEQESIDKRMEASGLLTKISHPASPTEYCFLHLTIQEFLAAKHVTKAFEPLKIESFISENIGNGKWHLVLQFIAGLLGREMVRSDTEFKGCFCAFTKYLAVVNDEIELNYNHVMVMKCLREVDDEKMVEDVCDTTILKEVKKIFSAGIFSASDWEAVAFVCRFMKNLEALDLNAMGEDGLQEVLKLLEKRCINELALQQQQQWSKGYRCKTEQVFGALTKLECRLSHKCANLTSLKLECFLKDDAGLSNTCAFFKEGHARHLEKLCLIRTEITSSHSVKLFEAHCSKNCPELAELCFEINNIGDEGALVLWDTVVNRFSCLTRLELSHCRLTGQCISSLCKALRSEHCNLTVLSLSGNPIGDHSAEMLFEDALTKENCNLTTLYLDCCDLTERCVLSLYKALQSEHCRLTVLSLSNNVLDDNGVSMFFKNAFKKGNCKLTTLYLDSCFLRYQASIDLCEALQNEHCQLSCLSLSNSRDCVYILFSHGLTKEHCKLNTLYLKSCGLGHFLATVMRKAIEEERCQLTSLTLSYNSLGDDEGAIEFPNFGLANKYCQISTLYLECCYLSDRCIPSLSMILQDEHCKLTVLSLSNNSIGDEGVCRLFEEALAKEHCKLTELSLVNCILTDQCIPSLRETLKDEQCRLNKLHLESNKFTVSGEQSLRDIHRNQICKNRGLRIYLYTV